MPSDISNYLNQIRTAVYGREVREAIADGIEQCYNDTSNGVTLAETKLSELNGAVERLNGAVDNAEANMSEAVSDALESLGDAVESANGAVTTANAAATRAQELNTALGNNAQDLVLVQNEQPNKEFNKIWVDPDVEEHEVPTYQEFSDLKSALLNPTYTITEGKYVRGDNGITADSTTGSPSVISNVPVMPGDTINIVFSGVVYGGAIGYAFYDKYGSYVDGDSYTALDGNQTITAVVPETADTMAFTVFQTASYKFYGNTEAERIVKNINELRYDLNDCEERIGGVETYVNEVIKEYPNLVDPNEIQYSYGITNSPQSDLGYVIEPNSSYNTPDYIPVKKGISYTICPYRMLFYLDADKVKYGAETADHTAISTITPTKDGFVIFSCKTSVSANEIFVSETSKSTSYTPYGYYAGDFLREYVEEKITDPLYTKLHGKTVWNFGDSLADGDGNPIYNAAHTEIIAHWSYADYLAEQYEMALVKYSRSGATLGWRDGISAANKNLNIMTQVMDACAGEGSPDIILINGGLNDIPQNITLGAMHEGYYNWRENTISALGADLENTGTKPITSYFDITTTAGAFEWCVSMLRYYYPNALIIYVRYHVMTTRSWSQLEYLDEIAKICHRYGIKVIENELDTHFYTSFETVTSGGSSHVEYHGGMADYTSDYYGNYHDGTHPNEAGYLKYYMPPLRKVLRELFL